MDWLDFIIRVLSGLVVCIPLVIKLIEYVSKSIKEKNWPGLLELVINLMKEAETKFDNGADRREWVLTCVKASADIINYDVDLDKVGEMIDSLSAMSKVVNAPKTEEVSK